MEIKKTIESETRYGTDHQPDDGAIVFVAIMFFTSPFWIFGIFNLFT